MHVCTNACFLMQRYKKNSIICKLYVFFNIYSHISPFEVTTQVYGVAGHN